MPDQAHFADFLKSRLPEGTSTRLFHISTQPNPCPPLYAPGPGRSDESTTLESHFLAISRCQAQAEAHNIPNQTADVLVLGIEVLVFTTKDLTTVFVSKADSTGFKTSSRDAQSKTSIAQIVITAFLDYLLRPRLCGVKLVLSLFARSQNQYLFPGSIENTTKHVLDDRQLIKWWCKVLDPLVRDKEKNESLAVKAHVVIPGCDQSETKAFFPPSTRADTVTDPTWLNAYPVTQLVSDSTLPPRCLVPRLPDDPKARFLEDLDGQGVENGNWRSLKSLEQFWEMMSYRQECSAGRLVGFVWVVFSHQNSLQVSSSKSSQCTAEQAPVAQETISKKLPAATSAFESVQQVNGEEKEEQPVCFEKKVSTSPPFQVPSETTGVQSDSLLSRPRFENAESRECTIPITSYASELERVKLLPDNEVIEELVLSADKYQLLMDDLLQQDFAGEVLAKESTQKWLEKAMTLASVSRFGAYVEGQFVVPKEAEQADASFTKTVNVLTTVRKKRKVESAEGARNTNSIGNGSVHVINSTLIRKKPKT